MKSRFFFLLLSILIILPMMPAAWSDRAERAKDAKPLILQEMTWTDVAEYLKASDMVIIPLGSTEQHGPHLPLGTDFYESLEMCKRISQKTGVLVAPVVMAGYSVYHSGFPGTLSLSPETFEKVLVETAEMLIRYGFKRIMFFNYHGGNSVIEQKAIHAINHGTGAAAVSIGIGAGFQEHEEELPGVELDMHAGINETSIMLCLRPDLVHMDRAEQPKITFSPKTEQVMNLAREFPELSVLTGALLGVPVETGKGGASRQISSNGVWSSADPKQSTVEWGKKQVDRMVESACRFIEAWRKI